MATLTPVVLLLVLVSGSHAQCLTQDDSRPHQSWETALEKIAAGEVSMSLNLFKEIISSGVPTNFIYSPYSIHQALLLAYFGSVGTTDVALRKVLGIPRDQDKLDVFMAYRKELMLHSNNSSDSYTMKSSNRIYISNRLRLRQCMAEKFQNELVKIDYTNPQLAENTINSWVEANTEGQIKNLIQNLSFRSSVTLVNAAYFKGKWLAQFPPENTKREVFHDSENKQIRTDMMKQKGWFNYMVSEDLAAEILEMAYKGEDVSMFILLPSKLNPSNTVDDVIRRLSVENFNDVIGSFSMSAEEVNLAVPKFIIESKIFLDSALKALGLGDSFSSAGDFSGFTGRREVFFSDIIQKAKVEVNEEGTRAYAATGIVLLTAAMPQKEPINFICNRPFAYIIYNRKSHNILFMGVYKSPNQQ